MEETDETREAGIGRNRKTKEEVADVLARVPVLRGITTKSVAHPILYGHAKRTDQTLFLDSKEEEDIPVITSLLLTHHRDPLIFVAQPPLLPKYMIFSY